MITLTSQRSARLRNRACTSFSPYFAVAFLCFFFFQAEDGIRDYKVTGVQTCALPISVMTRFRLLLPLAVLALLPPPRAAAWGEVGHATVAKLAWDRMTDGQKLKASTLDRKSVV